jgi:hypothetical protein
MTDTFTVTGTGSIFPDNPLFDTIQFWDLNIEYNNGLKVHFVSTNMLNEMMKNLKSVTEQLFMAQKAGLAWAVEQQHPIFQSFTRS